VQQQRNRLVLITGVFMGRTVSILMQAQLRNTKVIIVHRSWNNWCSAVGRRTEFFFADVCRNDD